MSFLTLGTRAFSNRRMVRLILVVATVAALLAASPATAAAGDDISEATRLTLNETAADSNVGFSVESGEPLSCGTSTYRATAWYMVFAEGDGEITVSTFGSDFDTVLAVYGPEDGSSGFVPPRVGCQDDFDDDDLTSDVTFDAQDGELYWVQVGGFCGGICDNSEGNLKVTALSEGPGGPANDNRGAAENIPLGQKLLRSNGGATTGSETVTCGGSTYGMTVWFRFTVPATGDAVITASSTTMDPVVAVYAPGSNDQIGCNDDAPGESFSSRLPVRLGPGEYFLQVGGFDTGVFELEVTFTVDRDLDDDGVSPPQDCNDGNAGIRPGVPEQVNNGVDENCDGVLEYDRDGDGSRVPGAPADCDDGNPARSPLKPEVRGNRVDENCDGEVTPFPIIPSRVVSAWKLGKVTKLSELILSNALRGSTLTVRCRRSGCGFRSKTIRVGRNAKQLKLQKRFTQRQRRFGKKARLVIVISAPNYSSKETIYRMRPGRVPTRQEYCITDARREC